MSKQAMFAGIPPVPDCTEVRRELAKLVAQQHQKIFVLDDDPTGIQTVHGVPVYTDWQEPTLREAFQENCHLVYILTNTRAMPAAEAESIIAEVTDNLCRVSQLVDMPFTVMLRSDSTLRGHYPLENRLVRDVVERAAGLRYDGEILIPFFGEGGRFTYGDIHWVETDGMLRAVAQTEFAEDSAFGFQHSDLKRWIEEKTCGCVPAGDVISISLGTIRMGGPGAVADILEQQGSYRHYIVNAVDYADLFIFAQGLLEAERQGKRFLIRSAASFVKVRGYITDQALLSRDQLLRDNGQGGLVVVGSHVSKTTRQLEQVISLPGVTPIELQVHRLLSNEQDDELSRVLNACTATIQEGRTAVLFTSREVVRKVEEVSDANLTLSCQVSDALVGVVSRLKVSPSFLIAKGGITSSDIGTKALRVKRALAAGQIRPGIPVWYTSEDSKFRGLPFIIFPGNVGDDATLKDIVQELGGTCQGA